MQIAILSVGLLLAIILIFRMLFPINNDPGKDSGRERRTGFGEGDAFHAVSILAAEDCCTAVNSIGIQRFLSEEAPALPLENCGAAECRCRYVHHTDRRSGARDRRLGAHASADEQEFWGQRCRRASAGRRQGDLLPA